MAHAHQPAGQSRAVWYGMVEEDNATDPLPTELNTIDHPRFLAVSKDKRTVRATLTQRIEVTYGAVEILSTCVLAPKTYAKLPSLAIKTGMSWKSGALTHNHPANLKAAMEFAQSGTPLLFLDVREQQRQTQAVASVLIAVGSACCACERPAARSTRS